MTRELLQTRRYFQPRLRQIYTNEGGGDYMCISENGDNNATMVNMISGWTFMAWGIGVYADGTIDWDWSTNGRFEKIPE